MLDGVVMMLTGTDEGGVQIGEFGSSEGYLDENIMWVVRAVQIREKSSSKVTSLSRRRQTWSVVDLWLLIQHLISLQEIREVILEANMADEQHMTEDETVMDTGAYR